MSRLGALFIHDIESSLVMKLPYDGASAVDEDVDVVLAAGVATHLLADSGAQPHVSSPKVRAPR